MRVEQLAAVSGAGDKVSQRPPSFLASASEAGKQSSGFRQAGDPGCTFVARSSAGRYTNQ